MLVTEAVFHEDIFPLKAVASLNKAYILVTAAVFQSFKVVPTKLVHSLKALAISVVNERSGSSVAGIVKLVAPLKELFQDPHFPSPQFVIV